MKDEENLDQGEELVDMEATTGEAPEERPRDEKGRFKRTSLRDQIVNEMIAGRKRTVSKEIGQDLTGDADVEEPQDEEPEHKVVKVKVYDQEFDVDQETVDAAGGVESYQKIAAANYKLDQAKQRNAEAAALAEENARLNEELRKRLEAADSHKPQVTIGDDGLTEAQRESLARLSEDYPEEIVETRRDLYLLQNSRNSDDVVKKTTDRVVTEMRGQERDRERLAANALFTEKFSHVESDQYLNAIAQAEAQRLLAENPNRDLRDLVLKAGNKAQEYYDKLHGRNFENKQARKRAAGNPPSGGSKRLPAKPEVRPPTTQEIIAEMRAARGLVT